MVNRMKICAAEVTSRKCTAGEHAIHPPATAQPARYSALTLQRLVSSGDAKLLALGIGRHGAARSARRPHAQQHAALGNLQVEV